MATQPAPRLRQFCGASVRACVRVVVSVVSKLSPQQADGFFYQGDMKIREKGKFFVNRSVPENFQWENFLGQVPTESLRTQDSENVYERWVQQIFDPVLPARSWEKVSSEGCWCLKKGGFRDDT